MNDYVAELRSLLGHRPVIFPGASVVVTDDRGRVLLLARADTGGWGLPAGLMDPGESFEDTARREVLEETGLIVGELALLGLFGDALRTWTDRFVDYWATKIGLGGAIRAVVAAGRDPFAQSRDQVDAAVAALLSATAAAGITRPEVAPDDVVVAPSGIAMVADVLEDRDQVGRVLDLVFEGIRTRP
ncbi:NUDIX domain-containing protein [Actinacidiphila paucisporea]|uniref:ADP-ribose pyrophosphatase YjhB, NUDIX family n=1 Tax=Actinacidiphila paucisporea TaxID=310782 RepID=A0A1M7QWD7_9ACTN|nr:NUDIX domain-containing protein [Actinacidiphila paucisporea]SHN35955.1 ADP-ribose pyrophosphatase YjhB, NUDIX family [Actinacidiphila paucisporea]